MLRDKARLAGRVWWLNAAWPLALAVILFLSLTFLIYSGRKHRRIASFFEEQFITVSLRLGSPVVDMSNDIVAVNLTRSDWQSLAHSPVSHFKDVMPHVYAKLINKVVERGGKHIFLSWTPAGHPEDATYYEPLTKAIHALPKDVRIVVGSPQGKAWAIPDELSRETTIASDINCQEPTQILCNYEEAPGWINHEVINVSGTSTYQRGISENLTVEGPAYLLNLPSASRLAQRSFSDVLEGQASFHGQTVFIGNSVYQSQVAADQHDVIRRVRTAKATPSDIRRAIPKHIYWAQLSYMFKHDLLVEVAPQWLTLGVSCFICLFIWYMLISRGAATALGSYLILCASAPLANALSVKFLLVYVPLFDTLYSGLATFMFAGFGTLSYETFSRWRLEERIRFHAHTADLKSNFISLLSHNLNTPIAKLQGIVQILRQQSSRSEEKYAALDAHIAKLQLIVRYVLVTSRVEEGHSTKEAMNLEALLSETRSVSEPPLKRLGLNIKWQDIGGEEELRAMPVSIDRRMIPNLFGAMCASFVADPSDKVDMTCQVAAMYTDAGDVRITFSCEGPLFPSQSDDREQDRDFLATVGQRLIERTTKALAGSIKLKEQDQRRQLEVAFEVDL